MTFAFIFESVGGTEWLVLLGVILVVVGPKNLPAAARKFGQITAQLRRAADEFKRQIMAMDEEVRRTVDDAVKTDYVETPKDDPIDDPSKVPDDAAVDGDGDRAVTENDYYGGEYDENSPYPGHASYDGAESPDDGTTGDASANPQSPEPDVAAPVADVKPEPRADPYAIKITVSTNAEKKKGAKA